MEGGGSGNVKLRDTCSGNLSTALRLDDHLEQNTGTVGAPVSFTGKVSYYQAVSLVQGKTLLRHILLFYRSSFSTHVATSRQVPLRWGCVVCVEVHPQLYCRFVYVRASATVGFLG